MKKSYEKIKREQIIRDLIIKNKETNGVSYKFFITMLSANKWKFSQFINWKIWISSKRLAILENYFKINVKK